MPGKAPRDEHAIIYVRVPPEEKRRLRELADREFDGSMAACFRYLLDSFVKATPGEARAAACVTCPECGGELAEAGRTARADMSLSGRDLDED